MVFATKDYTVGTYTARFVVAQFIVRLWLEEFASRREVEDRRSILQWACHSNRLRV